jgi:hypothetical protein
LLNATNEGDELFYGNVKDEKTLKIIVQKKNEIDALNINLSAKALLVSNWKYGCDMIGEILSQHPATFYHYEPLAWKGVKRFNQGFDNDVASNQLKTLFKCNYGTHIGRCTLEELFTFTFIYNLTGFKDVIIYSIFIF